MRSFFLGFIVAIIAMIVALGIWRRANHRPFFPSRVHSTHHAPSAASESPAPHSAPTPKSSRLAAPTPEKISTPIIPNKRMATAELFNGIAFHATMETTKGTTAIATRDNPASYALSLNLKVAVPHANADLNSLRAFNPFLATTLPSLTAMLAKARVSPFFDELYRFKIERVERALTRLDELLSRHNFYDCETMLDLESPTTKRHAILIQTDMDVDMDGSDGDRIAPTGTWTNFQPTTSYRWRKKTDFPNPYLALAEQKLARAQMLEQVGTSKTAHREVLAQRDLIYQLKKYSFLIGATDPYVVLPLAMITHSQPPYKPSIGDYCVVIYNNALYPAIVGDAGPSFKSGEASLRICHEINPRATAESRPVEDPKITYLVFPGTAEKPFNVPNLAHWRARCEQLLNEMGGYNGTLFTWTDLTKPVPTPTPVQTPTPTPTASPTPTVSPSASPLTTHSTASPTPTSAAAASSPLATPVHSPSLTK